MQDSLTLSCVTQTSKVQTLLERTSAERISEAPTCAPETSTKPCSLARLQMPEHSGPVGSTGAARLMNETTRVEKPDLARTENI